MITNETNETLRFETFVTTARRPLPTLARTMASIEEAGFWPFTIVAEPDSSIYGISPAIEIRLSPHRLGPWGALRKCLEIGVARKADFICCFQDDILLAKGAFRWLLSQLDEHAGLLRSAGVMSLYTASACDDGKIFKGWQAMPARDLPKRAYGALALVFPAESARLLLADPPNPKEMIRADLNVGTFCRLTNRPYLNHIPSLVWHTGMKSVAHPGILPSVYRQAERFVEDALELERWKCSTT